MMGGLQVFRTRHLKTALTPRPRPAPACVVRARCVRARRAHPTAAAGTARARFKNASKIKIGRWAASSSTACLAWRGREERLGAPKRANDGRSATRGASRMACWRPVRGHSQRASVCVCVWCACACACFYSDIHVRVFAPSRHHAQLTCPGRCGALQAANGAGTSRAVRHYRYHQIRPPR